MAKKPQPRDLGAELGALSQFAAQYAQAQAQAQAAANRQMIKDALKATDQIAGKLDNENTGLALGHIAGAGGQVPEMNALAERMGGLAERAEGSLDGTEIEAELGRMALEDLRLGRALSPEQEREATQAARAGFAARGMATGMPSAAAEILARDAYGTARQNERRGFAGSVNQMLVGNENARLGTAGNLLGVTAGTRQNTAALGMGLGQAFVAADPYQRALGSNIPIASQGPSASMTSNAFGQVLGYAGDLYNTNYNAGWSDYLNQQNLGLAQRYGGAGGGANPMLGALGGAASGAMAGTAFGPWGTAIGAGVGGVAGGLGAM